MAETQRLSTQILLDAALTGGYKDAFNSAGRLMSDLKRQSTDLRKQLGVLGKEADAVEKIGDSADDVRKSMKLLERQIESTERATQKFGDARSHFRKASIGARAFTSDIGAITRMAKKAAIAVGAIGLGAGYVAHRGLEKYSNFDQILNTLRAEGVADTDIPEIREQVLKFAGQTRFTALEIGELLVSMKKDGQEINSELRGFGDLLKFAVAENKDILTAWDVTRTYINATNTELKDAIKLQEELSNATSLSKLQIEDYGFIAGKALSTFANLENFDTRGFNALAGLLADTGIQAETVGITLRRFPLVLAEAAHGKLAGEKQTLFDQLGIDIANSKGELKDIISILTEFNTAFRERGYISDENKITTTGLTALGGIFDTRYADAIGKMITGYEKVEKSMAGVGKVGTLDEKFDVHSKTLFAAQKRFESAAESFVLNLFQIFDDDDNFIGMFDGMTAGVNRFLAYIKAHKEQIQNFFTGIRDGVSPVVKKVWNFIREAYPDVKQFATGVWTELKKQWDAVAPAANFVADTIWSIFKAIGGFLRDHPRLVATVIAGVAAWKGYKIVSNIFSTAGSAITGFVSLAQGHFHRLNALVLGNMRVQGGLQKTTLSTGQKFLTMGKDMFATKFPNFTSAIKGIGGIGSSALASLPGIGAMGASLWGALAPILPVALPVIAAVGGIAAGGYLIYKNWEGIKSFFVDNFDTIRNVMWIVAPPIGFLMTAGQFIMRNWEPIKEFFSTVGETIKLVFQVAFEGIRFVALQALVGIKKAWGAITGFFQNIWAGVTAVFTKSPLAPVFNWMVGGVKKVVSPLFSFFDNFWDNIFDKGKAVIQWITDKFNFVNNLLKKAFGWLRKKNEEAVAELKAQSSVVIEAQVDVPNAVAGVNQEIDAVLEAKQPEPAVVDIAQPEMPISEVINEVQVSPQVSVTHPEIPVMESAAVVNEGQVEMPQVAMQPVEMPTIPTPQVNVSTPQTAYPDISIASPQIGQTDRAVSPQVVIGEDLTHTALGILAEARKQTEILTSLSDSTVDEYGQSESAAVEVKLPKVDIPQTDVYMQQAPAPAAPEVVNKIDIAPAVVNVKTPAPAVAQVQQPQIEQIPQAYPEVVDQIDVDSPEVDIAMPAPAVAELHQPKTDVPQAAAAEVNNQINVYTSDVQIAKADPPVVDMRMYTSAVEQMQQPQEVITQTPVPEAVNQIGVVSPEVHIAKPDAAVAEMKTPEPNVVDIQQAKIDIPQAAAPEVINQISVPQANVEMAKGDTAVVEVKTSESISELQSPPTVGRDSEIAPTKKAGLQSRQTMEQVSPAVTPVDVQMAETAGKELQQPAVELRSPSVDTTPSPAEYLRDMVPEQQRTDVFRGDELVGVGLGILSETRKQTGILEGLNLEPVVEPAAVMVETPGLVVETPGLVLDEYGQPTDSPQGQQITHHEQVTNNETRQPTVEVVNNFQIVQQPDQDPEALAELIAAIVRDTVDQSADTFLIT